MDLKREKKSQSEVITTVLIILLVIAAVAIVWSVVNNIVSKGASSAGKSTTCTLLSINIVNINKSLNMIQVHRTDGETDTVANIKFIINGKAATTNNIDTALGQLETKDYIINSTTLAINDKVEAAVILSDGGICDQVVSSIVK
jgi:flagellin-like protein